MAAHHRITVSFEEQEYNDLIALSKAQDRSLSWLVRQATIAYLEDQSTPEPESKKEQGE